MNKKAVIAMGGVLAVGITVALVGLVKYNKDLTDEVYKPIETLPSESKVTKVPESLYTETMEETQSVKDAQLSDTTICATFDEDIRGYCEQVFGEYLVALQRPYYILQDIGYEYVVAYRSDPETVDMGDNYLAFNIYLPGARGRFTITKSGDTYNTVFHILEAGEHETTPEVEEEEDAQPVMWEHTTNPHPQQIPGYTLLTPNLTWTWQDSEYVREKVPSAILDMVESPTDLSDMVTVLDAVDGWSDVTGEKVEDGIRVYSGNYMFHITTEYTDVYEKN